MKKTKRKILDAALKLFNQDGIVNVRLQHIADEAFVSVGNLAYHFPNKEAIALSIYQQLANDQDDLLKEYRLVPLFENIDRLIQNSFQLQLKYPFFYLDTLEVIRAYPSIAELHRQRVKTQVQQLYTILEFNVARAALSSPTIDGQYEQLAKHIWMIMDLYMAQQKIQSDELPDAKVYRMAIWSLLQPHFTRLGALEYQQMLASPYDFYF